MEGRCLGLTLGKDKQEQERISRIEKEEVASVMPNGHGGFRKCWFPF